MKIAYNPKTAAVITTATAANDDILFDLNAKKVWAKGTRIGADWADISSKPSSLKNPYALTISLNGASQGPYDGSTAKNINITPGSIGAATSGHNHDGRYVYNYGGTNMDANSLNKNALGMSNNSGITGDWWHILQASWNNEYRWNSLIAFPTLNKNGMYYRSGLDNNTAWGDWVKLLDVNNSYINSGKGYINGTEITLVNNASKLQTARNLWGNSFDGTKDINGSIVFPAIGDTATSNKISWSGSTDGADIYYLTTGQNLGNLVLNVKDDTNEYILLALNGTFKSHFDVANSYWTGRSAQADKWTTARTITLTGSITGSASIDGSRNVSLTTTTNHTHTFASLTSKPTTLSGYGITDAIVTKLIISKNDYLCYIILLCKIGTNSTNTQHTINGTFWTTSAGGARYQAAYINIHCSDWTNNHNEYFVFTPFGLGTLCRLVTCTYQSNKYIAVTFENIQACNIYFDGSYSNILFTPVLYYTSNTGTIGNSEIYNSISEVISYKKIAFTTDNVASATKLTSSAGSATLPIYFSDGKPVACTASSIFSNLSNSGNNLSITVAGQNRTLTVGYATSADYTNGIANKGRLNSQEKIDNFITANRFEYATFKTTESNNVGFASNDGMILSIPFDSRDYGAQIAFDDIHLSTVKVRSKNKSWGNWHTLLHSGNYNAYSPTLTGAGASGTWGINITGNADTVDGVHVTWRGTLTSTSHLVAWEADGSALRDINPANVTVGNSDKLDGFHATNGNNKPWGTIPVITTGGYMDIGKHLEFHYDNSTGSDYSTILRCTGNYSNIVNLPSASGTLALTSDIPSSLKNPYSLTLLANGTTLATYDGSISKIVNLTYDNVGAAAKNHTHNSLEPWASYITGDSHATALKSIFDKNKTSIPRNKFISMYSSAYGNGSCYMGYFLSGYENSPYGGFFVAHYDTAYYIGISNGSFTQHRLVYSTDIPNSLKNPHALTISLNGTSQGSYDGSATKSINITPSSIGAATSGHNHDNRYLKLTGGTMQLGEGLKFHSDDNYFGTSADARIISLLDGNDKVCDGGLIIDERGTLDGKEYVTELLRIRHSEFKWKGSNILHSGNSNINGNTITINGSSLTVSKSDHTHAYLPLSGGNISGTVSIRKDLSGNLNDWILKLHNGPLEVGRASNTMCVAIGVTDDNYGYIQTKGKGITTPGNLVLLPGGGNLYKGDISNVIWHAGNDGSGSGLDADLLDGNHASGLLTTLSNSNNGISITVGGTTKSVSNISVNYANSAGSAGSATAVIVHLNTTTDANYPLVWSNLNNTNNVTENQLYKSWSDLYYNPKNKRLTVGGSVVASSFVKSGGTSLQLLRADGGIATFNWSGQSGLPTWLWGGNNLHSYYVYNPSNFRVAYATSSGNADTLDSVHLSGIFTAFGNNNHNITATIGGVTKSFLVNWTADSDKLDGYHADKYLMVPTTIDTTSLNSDTYYPVTIWLPCKNTRIEVEVSLDSGTKPSWSTHQLGFTSRKVWESNGAGWGTTSVERNIFVSTYSYASEDPIRGIGQLTSSSNEFVYVRGGGKYYFRVSVGGGIPTLRKENYTINSQSVAPTKTAPDLIVPCINTPHRRVTLWGQSFNGTNNVSGSLSNTGTITASAAATYDIGSNALDYRYGYFQWIGAKSNTNLRLAANNSDNQIVLHTNGNVGIGTNTPTYKLYVAGDIYTTTGFKKNGSSNSYILLGGGSHKLISDFATSNHTHSNYVTALGTNGNYLTWTKNGSTNNITVPYATTSSYLTSGFSAPWVGKWDCNAPDRVVYSDYGSSGRSIANAPSGWLYGTLLELGHTNHNGLNGNLNILLMWDVAHNTTNPGTLWFRGKDLVKGWAKSWAKVITDLNISSILSNYYTKSETDGRYLRLDGSDTMTGVFKAKANQYNDDYDGAINMNNSDIYGLNSIYTADRSDAQAEGIHFWRDSTHVDTLRMMDGKLLFTPNRPLGGSGTEQIVLHTGNSHIKSGIITINGSSITPLTSLPSHSHSWDSITGKPASFTPSAHDHNYVLDIANNKHTTFAYSKSGLSKDSITWLAVWNGYELRAMNKDQVALSGHTHDDRYLKLTGGTMTGTIRFNNLIDINSAIVLDYKYSAGGFARDIVSMKNSVYGDANLGALSILCYPNSTSNGFLYIYLGTDKYDGPNNLRIYKDKVTFGNNILIDAGNIGSLTVANAYHLRINSANTWSTWYWSGLSGQPSWLWGSNDGTNMYVWNPSNFRVAYASSAGNADTLDGLDSTKFLRQVVVPNNTENDFNTFLNMTLTGRVDPTTGASLKNAPWSGSGPAGGYGVLTYLFNGYDYGTQMAWEYGSNRIYIRNKHWGGSGVGSVWRTSWDKLALTTDIPSSLKNPYSLNVFGVAYDGSAAKTVTTSTFVSLLSEGTSTVTDGTMFITSVVSNSGFADTSAVNVPYKRKASCLWSYIDSKVSSKYLPLAGGTMNGNARIGHGSGNLYIGNSGNDGWIYTQDIASQLGTDKWWVRESGAAHFGNVYICTKSDYTTYDSSIIECYSDALYLNYYSSKGINLCNGGGTVQIGPRTTGDTGNNKLYVNGSEFINGASNVKDHVFANGFRHRSHNSNDSVLLAGGGYSQGVPVRYWAIYYMYIGNSSTDVTYTKRSGNYDFITSEAWESEGSARFDIRFPSGYNRNNTLIFGNGDHRTSSSWKTPVYVTITTSPQFGSEFQIRVMISNDSSFDSGFANIYFMCMG